MKNKLTIKLLIFIMSFSFSCKEKIIPKSHETVKLEYGYKVSPYFVKKYISKKRLKGIFYTIPFTLGTSSSIFMNSNGTYKSLIPTLALGFSPLIFFRGKEKIELANTSEFNIWLDKYNKKNKTNYVPVFSIYRNLYISNPENSLKLYNQNEKLIVEHQENLKRIQDKNNRILGNFVGALILLGTISSLNSTSVKSEDLGHTKCNSCNGKGGREIKDFNGNITWERCIDCGGDGEN